MPYTAGMAGCRTLRGRALASAVLFGAVTAWAAQAGPVRVGTRVVSIDEVEARLRLAEERGRLKSGAEQRLEFVRGPLVDEWRFAEEARRQELDQSPAFRFVRNDILYQALAEREAEAVPPPTPEAVAAYYRKHERDFVLPSRIRIWRILVSSEARAKAILKIVRGAEGPKRWREQSRKWSVDAATKQRGGDVGFVRADGSTDVPQVRVDPALYEAVADLPNGALAPEPVREEGRFAVVWRRGSLDEQRVSLEQARPTIESRLRAEMQRKRLDALLEDSLPKVKPHAALLDRVQVPAFPTASPSDG